MSVFFNYGGVGLRPLYCPGLGNIYSSIDMLGGRNGCLFLFYLLNTNVHMFNHKAIG
jgi:hypothetical protein